MKNWRRYLIAALCLLWLCATVQAAGQDKKKLLSEITFWNPSTGQEISTFSGERSTNVIAFSPNGKLLATGNADGTVLLWDVEEKRILNTLTGHKEAVQCVAFSPDGKRLASGSWDESIKLWDVASGKEIITLKGHKQEILAVAFSPDGKILASAGADRVVIIWDLARNRMWGMLIGHSSKIISLAFSSDGKRLVTGSHDKTVRIWEVATRKSLLTIGNSESAQAVAFSPDGKFVASGGREGTVTIWESTTGQRVYVLKGHYSSVSSVSFSPDGRTLASASYDQSIKIWNVNSGQEIRTLERHGDKINSMSFSPNGQTLASSSGPDSTRNPKMFLISIGVSQYLDTQVHSLRYATKDAKDIAATIEQVGQGVFDTLSSRVLTDKNATLSAIQSTIADIVDAARPQDTFIFFYAGQARTSREKTDAAGQFFLLPSDFQRAKGETPSANDIADALLQSWLIKIQAQQQLIILDTPYSAEGLGEFISRIKKENKTLEAFGRRKIALLATNESYQSRILKNGLLTHLVLKGLTSESSVKDGQITVSSLVQYIQNNANTIPKTIVGDSSIQIYTTGDDFVLGTRPQPKQVGQMERKEFWANPAAHRLEPSRISYSRNLHRSAAFLVTASLFQEQEKPRASVQGKTDSSNPDSGPLRAGKDYAVLFATDTYDDSHWDHLNNPVFDAKAIADELQTNYGFLTEVVEDPKQQDILNVLLRYKNDIKYSDDDQLFIFFAGHGTFLENLNDGCLISRDSSGNDMFGLTCVQHSLLRRLINLIPCKHIFLVIDACFSGAIDESIARRGGDRDYAEATNHQFIRKKMQFRTRQFLTSGGKEYVIDGNAGQHSPFARRFLEALRSYGGQYGILTINDILSHVERVLPIPHRGEWPDNVPGSDFIFVVRKPN